MKPKPETIKIVDSAITEADRVLGKEASG